MIEDFEVGGEGPSLEFLELSNSAAARKAELGCRMIRWRSTREGTIYRTKQARADLTYLLAISVKSEDTQMDMVTVRTVIKRLCKRFDRKRS